MPVESDGESDKRKPQNHPPSDILSQSLSNENPPSVPTNSAAEQDEPIALKLGNDIKSGERWLIGVGIATLLINSIIALIYLCQLKQMREATKATQDAVGVARDTLTASEQAAARQTIDNDNASKAAKLRDDRTAKVAADSLRASIVNFHQEQRAYLIPGVPEDTSGYGLVRFPILNLGRFTAKHIVITSHFERRNVDLNTGQQTLVDRRDASTSSVATIPPSDTPFFYMMTFIPQKRSNDYSADLAAGTTNIIARGVITYDSGFGESDSIVWCYAWHPQPARWQHCGGSASAWLDSEPNTYQQPDTKR